LHFNIAAENKQQGKPAFASRTDPNQE